MFIPQIKTESWFLFFKSKSLQLQIAICISMSSYRILFCLYIYTSKYKYLSSSFYYLYVYLNTRSPPSTWFVSYTICMKFSFLLKLQNRFSFISDSHPILNTMDDIRETKLNIIGAKKKKKNRNKHLFEFDAMVLSFKHFFSS